MLTLRFLRECWNWQTGKTKDLVGVCSCGFKSHLPHGKCCISYISEKYSTFLFYRKVLVTLKVNVFPVKQKCSAGSHCDGKELCCQSNPPQAENSALQGSFLYHQVYDADRLSKEKFHENPSEKTAGVYSSHLYHPNPSKQEKGKSCLLACLYKKASRAGSRKCEPQAGYRSAALSCHHSCHYGTQHAVRSTNAAFLIRRCQNRAVVCADSLCRSCSLLQPAFPDDKRRFNTHLEGRKHCLLLLETLSEDCGSPGCLLSVLPARFRAPSYYYSLPAECCQNDPGRPYRYCPSFLADLRPDRALHCCALPSLDVPSAP